MSRRHEIGVGCLVLVAVGILVFMALQIGAIRGMGQNITVSAEFADAAGLNSGAVVSVAGVQVGRVDELRVQGAHAIATLGIEKTAAIRQDAKVAIRARSVLGEKYVEISPVSADAPLLADGGELVAEAKQVEIDQLVSSLGPLVGALDPAAFKVLGDALKEDPDRAKRMLDDAERILHNAAIASDELPGVAQKARATLDSVERTSESARPVIAHADRAIGKAETTLVRADELVASVDPAKVDALFDDLSAMVKGGRAVVEKVDASTGKVEKILDKADSFSKEDWLRITQEEGVLIRLAPRDPAEVYRQEVERGVAQ
jgi:phospholipid/cholesterol/gamma-HCH transport system substrate-binding protein